MKKIAVIIQFALVPLFVALIVGAGFLVCVFGPTTHALSSAFAQDAVSPYGKDQLVTMADAARDYAFVINNELRLYQIMYDVAKQSAGAGESPSAVRGGAEKLPAVGDVTDANDLVQLRKAFDGASERYCFSREAISHLDDCYAIARTAYALLGASAVLAVAGMVFLVRAGGQSRAGTSLLASGIVTLCIFAVLGAWAAIDFDGFFTAFHGLLFSQGNWTFSYDSLLICALPTELWMGMGGTCLGLSIVLSVVAIVIGSVLRSQRRMSL